MTSADVVSPPAPAGGLTFIEQLHAVSVQLCPHEKVPWLTGYGTKEVILLRGSCGLWSCPVCGARNGKQWLARILNHINTVGKGRRWYFLTITAHEKWRGPSASVKNLRQGWKKLYNRMRRQYGVSEYVRVWEFHRDGSFHLHVLIARKIGKRWLKTNSRECGMGYQCDSSASKNGGQVAGYVCKYLLKSFEHADRYQKGMRRIECSRNWTPLPDLADASAYDWEVTFSRGWQTVRARQVAGRRVIIDRRPVDSENVSVVD